MKNLKLLFLLSLTLLSFTACKNDKDTKILLSENWSYTLDESGNSGWKSLPMENLTNLPPLLETGVGYVWLKNEVKIPSNLENDDLSIYLGRITMADETYFNGSLIGTGGYFPPKEWSSWNKVRLYNIPTGIINKGIIPSISFKKPHIFIT